MTPHPASSRRNFLKTAAASAAVIGAPSITRAEGVDSRRLKVGLVGCGGRGSGAADDAMKADSNVELWATADVFPEAIEGSLNALRNKYKDRVTVTDERK